jgi:hypothetical protein
LWVDSAGSRSGSSLQSHDLEPRFFLQRQINNTSSAPLPPLSAQCAESIYFYFRCCNTSLNAGFLLLLMKEGGLAWLGILWDRRGELDDWLYRHDHSNETHQACSLGSVGSIWDRRGELDDWLYRHDHSNETRQCC